MALASTLEYSACTGGMRAQARARCGILCAHGFLIVLRDGYAWRRARGVPLRSCPDLGQMHFCDADLMRIYAFVHTVAVGPGYARQLNRDRIWGL